MRGEGQDREEGDGGGERNEGQKTEERVRRQV